MPSLPVPGGRISKRTATKSRASLIVTSSGSHKRVSCLVVDTSKEGFRLRGTFHLRRGQVVEIILDDEPLNSVRCSVVWVGKAGSKYEGEAGLQTV
jgi:PilZ domain